MVRDPLTARLATLFRTAWPLAGLPRGWATADYRVAGGGIDVTRKPTSNEWQQISALFDTLVDLPAETREQRLTRLQADSFVIEQLRSLLSAEGEPGVLDGSASTSGAAAGDDDTPSDYASLAPGASVGSFRIERLIGRGGMGEVYLAHREGAAFDQRVALKLLRPEAAGRTRLFDSERRLLAGLEHPGIARLIDGGLAPDGRPFMALEYVEGQEITAWCAAHKADLNTRLTLFLGLCDAVEYAHARLVLHLDIKPSNILVDSEGRARLLDFGVAKIIDAAALDRTMTQALLTPDYAAPEQFGGARPTAATDVYALGAVLFELLAGRGPWQFDDAPLPTVLRRLLHDDPSYPSRVTEKRGMPAAQIRGDLDAIVMKAMRRDPAGRYAAVTALADDIRRYLAFEPVHARGGTARYRAGRFLRRNRWAAGAAAVALLVLLVGAGGVAWQARETRVERDIARSEARKAEAVNNALSLMFRNAEDFGAGQSTTARDLLNDSAKRVVTEAGDPSETSAVVLALSELYLNIGDNVGAETLLAEAVRRRIGAADPVVRAKIDAALGNVKGATGKPDEALALLDQADKVYATDPGRFRKERLESNAARAQILRLQGNRDVAIKLLLDAQPEAEREYAENPRALLTAYNNLAVHLVEANRLDELDAVLKRADTAIARMHQAQSPLALSLLQMRGGWYTRKGDQLSALRIFKQATALRRKLYGPSMQLSIDLMQTGIVMLGVKQIEQGVQVLVEAKQMARTYGGPDTQVTQMIGINLAGAYAHLGDFAKARAELAEVQPGLEKAGRDKLLYGVFLRGRFELDVKEKRLADAKADLDAAETVFVKLGEPARPFAESIRPLRKRLADAKAGAK